MSAAKNDPVSRPARQRPAERVAVRQEFIDIAAETAKLKEDPAWNSGKHSARTLLNEPEFGIVLLALKKGGSLNEHRYEGRFTLQTLSGDVRVHLPDHVVELPAGRLVVVGPGVVHDVEAAQESTCLLTLVKP
jgi:quercetin dioxygenase-like cupin family protein